jgi:hypothetical protein
MVKRALLAVFLTFAGLSLASAESLPRGERISIPAGTIIHCRVAETLTTKLNAQGQAFTATVTEPVLFEGREAIPYGATLVGRISFLERPGRIRGVGEMRLNPETVSFPDGRTFPLSAVLMTAYGADDARVGTEGVIKGPRSIRENLQEVGGGSAVGSLVGLIFGHPWIGVVLGGTAGFVDRIRRGGRDLTLPAGTQLNYQLTQTLELAPVTRQANALPRGPAAIH